MQKPNSTQNSMTELARADGFFCANVYNFIETYKSDCGNSASDFYMVWFDAYSNYVSYIPINCEYIVGGIHKRQI